MLKGGGKSIGKELKISCIKRNSATASFLSRVLRKETYWVEQITFLLNMLPKIIRHKPAVIYYSDFVLGTYLWHLRRFLKFKYKLLFSNGAPNGPPFKTEDHVQQLLPLYVADAIAKGTPANKMTLLPYALQLNVRDNLNRINTNTELRKRLRLPLDKKIIISVGAINSYHKRMDYVVNEFAKLNQQDYYLLLLGQVYQQSESIIKLAEDKLDKNSYSFKQVNSEEVADHLSASDYFILASLSEGLPRVLLEALGNGLIPIVHDYEVTRQTLGNYGIFKDLTKENTLAAAISEVQKKNYNRGDIINFAYQTYSWDSLSSEYLKMINNLIA
jgi:glycosyltransferase involved in cell wall biosynthesis